MDKLKKISVLFLLTLALLVGCGKNADDAEVENTETKTETAENVQTENAEKETETEDTEKIEVNFGVMTGPTGAGSVNLIDRSKNGDSKFVINETITGTPDELVTGLANGEIDMAVVPANLASVIYNKTGKIKVLASNNLGVTYVIAKDENIKTLKDLVGKDIVAAGKGATPEVTFRYVLNKNDIDADKDLNLDFKSEATEVAQTLIANEAEIGLLPEPMVTNVLLKNPDFKVVLDINEEWEEVSDSLIFTGVLVGRSEFLEELGKNADLFLDEFEDSIDTALNDKENTAELLGKYEIIKPEIAKKANFNLYYMDGQKLKDNLLGYLQVLFDNNPKSVGGEMPEDDFFYIGE